MTMSIALVYLSLVVTALIGGWAGSALAVRRLRVKASTTRDDHVIHIGFDSTEAEAGIKRLAERVNALSTSLEGVERRSAGLKSLVLVAFIVAAGIGCQGCHPSPAPVVTPTGAAGAAPAPLPGGPATCLDFCRHGADLNCHWAADTPMGATCVEVCANNEKVAIAPWDLDCRTRSPACNPPACR